jgi:hypothetical protein
MIDHKKLTYSVVALELHQQYNFLPHLSSDVIQALFSSRKTLTTEEESGNVGRLISFCVGRLIRFQIKSRRKDQACTNPGPRKLEYMVEIERDFAPGLVAEVESSWNDSLQHAFLDALYSALIG